MSSHSYPSCRLTPSEPVKSSGVRNARGSIQLSEPRTRTGIALQKPSGNTTISQMRFPSSSCHRHHQFGFQGWPRSKVVNLCAWVSGSGKASAALVQRTSVDAPGLIHLLIGKHMAVLRRRGRGGVGADLSSNNEQD